MIQNSKTYIPCEGLWRCSTPKGKQGVVQVEPCGFFPPNFHEIGASPKPAEKPSRLIAVNKQRRAGGDKEVLITIVIYGFHMIDKKAVEMLIPTSMYSADIREDIILSYEWCQLREVDISAKKHRLFIKTQAKNSGSTVCVSQRPKNRTLWSVLWRDIGCGLAPFHPARFTTSSKTLW